MAKTLNQFLEGYLKVKNPDEQKFVDKHIVAKHADRNGNDDEVFKGSKVKMIDRRKDRKGYNPGEDEKVYEELKGNQHKIDHNKNGKIDAHDFKLLRSKKKKVDETVDDPKLAFQLHMAKKKEELRKKGQLAKEEVQIDELSNDTLRRYRMKAKSIADHGGEQRTKGRELAGRKSYGGRMAGIEKAKVMAKEETEALDETAKIVAHLQKRYGDNIRKSHVSSAAKDFGVDASKLAKAVRTKLGKNMLDEEQIDELSKSTMGAYTKKAAADFSARKPKMGYDGQLKKMQNRTVGVNRALGKMYGEEVEQIDELSPATKASYVKKAGSEIDKLYDKSKTDARSAYKYYGRKNTMRKIANEEVESVEEKLDMKKASMGDVITDFKDSNAPQFKGKSQDKRRAMAIAAKLTAERGGKPLRKEEKLADLLGDLTETHRRTMLSVFDKLNESNQKKFLEACETPEGVDSMLDFAISHRGE
jgi:hypothetical protein